MPYKEPKIEKLYYSIGEIAEMFAENVSLIRFWANKFDGIINPKKNKKGNRFFTPEDIGNFNIIYNLVKERGMTLDGAKKRMIDNKEGENKNMEIVNKLESIKAMLLDVKNLL